MAEKIDSSTVSNLVTLGAVALGWILGEATGWIKNKKKTNNLKNALFIEIQDALSWLKRNQLTIEKTIQLYALNHFPDDGPVPVPTHIYDKHFPEISVYLSRSERVSYNSIYNLISISHEQLKNLELLRMECLGNKIKPRKYAETLDAVYHNTSMAIWQITYHIEKGSEVDIDCLSGDDAKRIDNEIKERIANLIKNAKSSSVEKIKAEYYVS